RQTGDRTRAQGQRRDHTEAPATSAAQGPEETRVALLIARTDGPVGGHDLGFDEVVARQTPFAREHPDAPREREAGDADRPTAAPGDADTSCRQRLVHVDQLRAGADAHVTGPHFDAVHRPHVDDEPSAYRIATVAVATGAERDGERGAAGEQDALADVGGAR